MELSLDSIPVELSLDSIPLLAPSRIDYSNEDPKWVH